VKKNQQSQSWKRHSRKKSKRVLRSRRKKRREREKRGKKSQAVYTQKAYIKSKDGNWLEPINLVAPQNFSLVNNRSDMLKYFHSFENAVKRNGGITGVDLSEIVTMTCDAILYLLAQVNTLGARYPGTRIAGNEPENPKCKKVFRESGFYDFVQVAGRTTPKGEATLTVRSGDEVESEVAGEVINFALDKLKDMESPASKRAYNTIVECITNSHDHAHKGGLSSNRRWWVMATFLEEQGVVHFSCVDNGVGIPKTAKKRLPEHLRWKSIDAEVIRSALEGKIKRTRTGKHHRGKGLPQMYKDTKNGYVSNLHIISNNGSALVTSDGEIEIEQYDRKFYGTILSWYFIPSSRRNNG